MRRVVLCLALAALLVVPLLAAPAQPTVSGPDTWPYYYNPSTQSCLTAPEFAAALLPASVRAQYAGVQSCPGVPVEVDPWEPIKEWLSGQILYKPSPATLLKILGILGSFLAFVQAAKKLAEKAAKWAWLIKLIPQLGQVLAFLAHGIGPIILNACITGGTMLVAALGDGSLTGGEVFGIVTAVVGADLLYRLVFDWLKLLPRNVGKTP